MGGLLLRLRTWWETADRTQKAVTLFGGAFLALLLLGTFYFASKPKMELAFSGLSMKDLGTVTEEVKKLGIPMDFDQGGNILLPSDKVAQVKAQLATANKLPSSGSSSNLSDGGWMQSPEKERQQIRAALENQIADSLQSIEGVQGARVQITLGDTSPFANESKPPTASVTIQEKDRAALGRDQAKAIARLVAYSVQGLDTDHVSIVNQAGNLLWDGERQDTAGGQAQAKLAAEIAESKRRERDLQAKLDQAFGAGNTVATVAVSIDMNKKQTTSETPVISSDPASEETNVETMSGAGASRGTGMAGSRSNLATQPAAPTTLGSGSSGTYESKQTSKQSAMGVTRTTEEVSAGSVTGVVVTVLADTTKIADQQAVLEDVVKGWIGPKLASDSANYQATVRLVKFDTASQTAATKAAAAGAMGDRIQQLMSFLPILALMVVAFIVVKAIGRAAKDQTVLVQALPDGRVMPVAVPLSLTASTLTTSGADATPGALAARQTGPKPEIGEIPDNVNIPLEQIKKMTNERPEAVAMLIKSWLLEDRR